MQLFSCIRISHFMFINLRCAHRIEYTASPIRRPPTLWYFCYHTKPHQTHCESYFVAFSVFPHIYVIQAMLTCSFRAKFSSVRRKNQYPKCTVMISDEWLMHIDAMSSSSWAMWINTHTKALSKRLSIQESFMSCKTKGNPSVFCT